MKVNITKWRGKEYNIMCAAGDTRGKGLAAGCRGEGEGKAAMAQREGPGQTRVGGGTYN
jgi:hypothetical protein